MLNEMRLGCLSSKSISKFRSLSREPQYTYGIDPTELCVESHTWADAAATLAARKSNGRT